MVVTHATQTNLWKEAGAPPGLYTNLRISHEQAGRMIDDTRIKGLALTGSVGAGRTLAAHAGNDPAPIRGQSVYAARFCVLVS